jgi:hypothetical protein
MKKMVEKLASENRELKEKVSSLIITQRRGGRVARKFNNILRGFFLISAINNILRVSLQIPRFIT